MRHLRARFAVLMAIALSAIAARGFAQVENPAPATRDSSPVAAGAESSPAGLRESKPELHYLLDEHGKLVPVPSFRWEDFARIFALEQTEHFEPERPDVVIERLDIVGTASTDQAELTARLTISVHGSEWRSVPLFFDQCVLLAHTYTGGDVRLTPRNGGGLVAWVKGSGLDAVQLDLRLLKRLESTAAGERLSLTLPKAVSAAAEIKVAAPNAIAELPEGEGLVETSAADGGTLVRARLAADAMHLTWRARPTRDEFNPGWLEATGELDVRIDRDGIVTNAQLRLRSTAAPIDSFVVSLPAGATLLPGEFTAYAVELLSSEAGGAQRARIRLFEPNTVADVRLQSRQDWTSPGGAVDISGFNVEEAMRQRGHVACQLADELRADWEERFLVRQVEELPASLRNDRVQAGFEYSGQPFSLPVRISPRVTRLSMEPQYVVQVADRELLLNARIRCRVRGGKLRQVQLDPAGWLLDEAAWESDELIAIDDVDFDRTQPLVIPFTRAVEGEFELRFQARQPISDGAEQISFSAPRPLGTVVAPAQIVVIASDEVRLIPLAESDMKLVAQRPDATVSLPTTQQPPRFYRGDVTQARFAARYEVRQPMLEAETHTDVVVDDQRIDVREVITFHARHGGVDRVALRIPRDWAALVSPRLTLLGAAPAELPLATANRTASEIVEVPLPAAQFEDFDLEVRYVVPRDRHGGPFELPLVQPAHVTASTNELQVAAAASLAVNIVNEEWRRAESQVGEAESWNAALPVNRVLLAIGRTSGSSPSILVDRAWIRTLLVNDLRQEHVTWRITAPDGDVTLRLPEGVLTRDVTASVDGAAAQVSFDAGGRVTVAWPSDFDRAAPHLLEIDFHTESVSSGLLATLTPVKLASPGWIERTHWELLLPEQSHLLDVSSNYAREYAWRWGGTYWHRESDASEAELRTTRARGDLKSIPAHHNRYVVSAIGVPQELAITKIERSSLVLAASATALALGLTFLFFPALRRLEALLAVAMAAILAVAWWEDAALLFLQAAAPGIAAVLAALLVRGVTSRRAGSRASLQGSTHLAPRRGHSDRVGGSSAKLPSTTSRVPIHVISSETP